MKFFNPRMTERLETVFPDVKWERCCGQGAKGKIDGILYRVDLGSASGYFRVQECETETNRTYSLRASEIEHKLNVVGRCQPLSEAERNAFILSEKPHISANGVKIEDGQMVIYNLSGGLARGVVRSQTPKVVNVERLDGYGEGVGMTRYDYKSHRTVSTGKDFHVSKIQNTDGIYVLDETVEEWLENQLVK